MATIEDWIRVSQDTIVLSFHPSLKFRCDGEVSVTPVSVHGDIQFQILVPYMPWTRGCLGKRMGSGFSVPFCCAGIFDLNVELSSKSWI